MESALSLKSDRLYGRRFIWVAIAVSLLSFAAAARGEDSRFVATQTGELPIILSAPHGGALDLPDVTVRQGENLEKGPSGFVTSRDVGTEELAHSVAEAIERRFGKKPYFVISRAHRKYVDPNRPDTIAFEDPDARATYHAYHETLTRFCRDVQTKFKAGLLLDLHGQGLLPNKVVRGTQDGQTVTLLRQRFGEAAHTGEASLFGRLRALGWQIDPDPLDGREHDGYRGGYIVKTYGSPQYGVDAVQLEFGRSFRDANAREATAETLTDAVAQYAADYLHVSPPAKKAAVLDADDAGITVGVYQGEGASKSRNTLVEVLEKLSDVTVVDLSAEQVRSGKLAECDVLIQPGGSGSGQARGLGEEGRAQVREFVEQGGGYVGICAGAYLATCDYDWSLGILDAKVIDRKHWARGFGTVEVNLSPAGKQFFDRDNPRLSIYYHQGPLLAPADNPAIADFDSLAKFETEIAKNGAPPGIMRGCTAIALGQYHRGRVLCFSPHPELTAGLEPLLKQGITWAAGEESLSAATSQAK